MTSYDDAFVITSITNVIDHVYFLLLSPIHGHIWLLNAEFNKQKLCQKQLNFFFVLIFRIDGSCKLTVPYYFLLEQYVILFSRMGSCKTTMNDFILIVIDLIE